MKKRRWCKVEMNFKYVRLIIGRLLRKVSEALTNSISYIFLVFSVFVSIFLILPNLFQRAPVLSYYVSELELPMTYELCGCVKIKDENGRIVNQNVQVNVGGYREELRSNTDFDLHFTSPKTDEVVVVIRYDIGNEKKETIRYINIEEGAVVAREEFDICAFDD